MNIYSKPMGDDWTRYFEWELSQLPLAYSFEDVETVPCPVKRCGAISGETCVPAKSRTVKGVTSPHVSRIDAYCYARWRKEVSV